MRKVKFIANNYYHLFNRGVNRETIFPDERNWSFFIRLIRRYFRQELIDVVAYCLMPNHYHILVQLKSDDLGMQIMQPFSVSYTKAINKEQGRVGPLFQGPFQAKHVADENHLSWLSRYIHLNPVEAGLVSEPQEWPYSSYRDYVGIRRGSLPNTGYVLSVFESQSEYREYVEQSEQTEPREFKNIMMD